MRREWRVGLIALIALAAAAGCARYYAQLATPYYSGAARMLAQLYPWRVISLDTIYDSRSHTSVLFLKGAVFRSRDDARPAAVVVNRLQVGEVVETPLVFWGVLLLWPMSRGQRWLALGVGIPLFLGLEVLTTVCQLLQPMAQASALLAGNNDPLTVWDRWSRFLEAGGRFVVEVVAALLTMALARTVRLSLNAHRTETIKPEYRIPC